ncbi:MAG: glycoside hydrolase family 2 protein, partial [bacterium]|nr:glycoside hydrolase family 2 protein [bacterium]
MKTLDLCGQWHVRQKGETTSIPATVPGCIHTDLLSAGKIEDPYYRDNEARQMWIGETDWIYARTFHVDRELLECDRVLLKCDGLDTLAAISLNEAQVGKTDNQFRIWEFDVKPHLQVGENTLEICFESTLPYITEQQRRRSLAPGDTDPCRLDGSNRIRKSQCNYGWDWGPECVTAGIWRKIELLAVQRARIADLHIAQDHSRSDVVGLHVTVNV